MKKFRMMAALCAILTLMLSFTTVAYARGGEGTPAPEATREPNPFTPAGTGTVVNTATNEDGKQFYTITTPDENVFYLVIDLQRETDNVYFLDAVTEKDLLALAEKSGNTQDGEPVVSAPEPESSPEVTPAETSPEPSSEPEQTGNTGMLLLVLAIVVIGGGAGYYFKIYRPKHQQADSEDDFDYSDESGLDDMEASEQADELPPWEDEDDGDGKA